MNDLDIELVTLESSTICEMPCGIKININMILIWTLVHAMVWMQLRSCYRHLLNFVVPQVK